MKPLEALTDSIGSLTGRTERTVLLVCRRPEEVETAARFPGATVTVASDDYTTRQRAQDHADVNAIEYVEVPEKTFESAEPVIELINTLNRWFDTLYDGDEDAINDALQWVHNPEGGVTSQRILDVVYLVDSYFELFERSQPDEVVYHDILDDVWENDILARTAHSAGVPTTAVRSWQGRLADRLGLSNRRRRYWWTSIPDPFWPVVATLRQGKLHWSILSSGTEGLTTTEETADEQFRVSLYHRGSGDKHTDWTETVGEPFLESSQFDPVVTCWRNRHSRADLSEAGFDILDLEAAVNPSEWFGVVRRLWQVVEDARSQRDELGGDEFRYRGVPLQSLLWPWIEYFLLYGLFNRVGYVLGSERHLGSFDPDVARLPGLGLYTGNGVALMSSLERETDTLTINSKPTPHHTSRQYRAERAPANDVIFAAGERERERMISEGTPENRIEITGAPKITQVEEFESERTVAESRAALGIEDSETLQVVYMPQRPIRGQITLSEHYEVSRDIFDYAARRPELSLLVKPHPGDDTSVIPSLYEEHRPDGVVVADKEQLPYDCINVADVLVTKWSTTGFEGMLMGVPVVTISTADDVAEEMFGNGAVNCHNIEGLSSLFDNLLADPLRRDEWIEERLTAQRQFVDQNLNPDLNHIERTTQAIARRLSDVE